MRVLIACEFSGIVRDEFLKQGHDAWSCDLLRTESSNGPHYVGDVAKYLDEGWDLMIAHPPCTYLCSSGLHWNKRVEGRAEKTEEALAFVELLLNAPIKKIALENPVGCIGTRIRKADQYIQPYEFGHDASKTTGLWLKNLPLLKPTRMIPPSRVIDGKPRWANQTPAGQDKRGPSPTRGKDRAVTFMGIAQAMADQWG